MNKHTLEAALQFMERAPMTGKEALRWVQTYEELLTELAALTNPNKPQTAEIITT